ncbi:uncharacterized protein ASCRUDRAFT_76397 [Ascoidea rubescens DSM 1968]|uniref:Uncharacterized protein n=1 Tax=Ascoidea rubescens DSM 1968 TaxID=1344418 RepID=A0A1D2VFV7_9ASCO|nr:hypothetical protein ASCRUDRAFT_76397 [Ascoidea rubescens DSM 1968]ODV60410.1 hypothetical protein ASCRUDRAFT_76397 [Ascoidea rubescens DSM 1968]
MTQISEKKIELSNDGKKLVESDTGVDILDRDSRFKQELGGHLADPLKSLKEGDVLESPYQGANLVKQRASSSKEDGGRIPPYNWQEAYEDYLHDDDML